MKWLFPCRWQAELRHTLSAGMNEESAGEDRIFPRGMTMLNVSALSVACPTVSRLELPHLPERWRCGRVHPSGLRFSAPFRSRLTAARRSSWVMDVEMISDAAIAAKVGEMYYINVFLTAVAG